MAWEMNPSVFTHEVAYRSPQNSLLPFFFTRKVTLHAYSNELLHILPISTKAYICLFTLTSSW